MRTHAPVPFATRLLALLALLGAGTSGCAPSALDRGFGVGLILHFDDTVTDESLAQVRQLTFETDEPFSASLSLDRGLTRVERTIYRPLAQTHSLAVTVSALDESGLVLASGSAALTMLVPEKSVELDVRLSPIDHPDAGVLDGGSVSGDPTYADLAVADLAVADLAVADLAVADLAVADLAAHDLSTTPAFWTLVQAKDVYGAKNISISPTQAGSLIVVAFGASASAISDNASAGGNSYVMAAGGASCGAVWYAKSAKPGATTITLTSSDAPTFGIVVWEAQGLDPNQPFDVATLLATQPAASTAMGAAVTTATSGEFVISVLFTAGGVTGIKPGNEFTNDSTINGNGWGHLTNPNAVAGTHQAVWTQSPVGISCSRTVAFKRAP